MRFLADENVPGDAVAELEAAGYDIVSVRTMSPGSKDEDILALAVLEERIILTFDKDFGALWLETHPLPVGTDKTQARTKDIGVNGWSLGEGGPEIIDLKSPRGS